MQRLLGILLLDTGLCMLVSHIGINVLWHQSLILLAFNIAILMVLEVF